MFLVELMSVDHSFYWKSVSPLEEILELFPCVHIINSLSICEMNVGLLLYDNGILVEIEASRVKLDNYNVF